MSKGQFDPLIHAQNRLQICAILAAAVEMEFKVIKERLGVSDSVLSKHLKALQDAQYVKQTKRSEMGRQRTWLSLSTKGRQAYSGHLLALHEIVGMP
jgi:DNA-binding MarR family transcriptional regulator